MVMRIGGLASGINTDEIISKLMQAERAPLDRMEQDRTLLEWKRDGFREIYQKLYDMDHNLMLDMKKKSTYTSKSVSSSNEAAVTATANSNAQNGAYTIKVGSLATSAINVGGSLDDLGADFDPNKTLSEQGINPGTISFKTFDKATNAMKQHDIVVEADDSLNDVLKKITDGDNNARAFLDQTSNKVIIESTRTGNYNTAGYEIDFSGDTFFTDTLNLTQSNETNGTDATFTYNGVEFTSKNNSYTLNGVTFEFKNVTGDQNVSLTVDNNVDAAFDSIMNFVDKYNEIVEMVTTSQQEDKYYDYKPLTEEQKEGMEEKEIELWEEKAKSGILRGETILTSGLFDMRQSWYSNVDTGGEITNLTQVGIKTSANYMNGGKLEVDEEKLKDALRDNPEDVYKLFSNSTTDPNDPSRGLINRLEDSVESTMKSLEERAGNSTSTLENYTLGKRIKDLNTRISDFEDRLLTVENRYWSQFNAMEQAISRLNNQSTQLLSQFGG
ncbi:flagellar hook-associated protein 2 [Ornithinibacillus xuwenensis]|uniref:Flagellar hook-associated protein 2 n=1 Tax=Ornithinibacillus xuwenensis TaxID=3144668 RepID=A0ABU9XNN0_9BACI